MDNWTVTSLPLSANILSMLLIFQNTLLSWRDVMKVVINLSLCTTIQIVSLFL
jgi:hypothetical protein